MVDKLVFFRPSLSLITHLILVIVVKIEIRLCMKFNMVS